MNRKKTGPLGGIYIKKIIKNLVIYKKRKYILKGNAIPKPNDDTNIKPTFKIIIAKVCYIFNNTR